MQKKILIPCQKKLHLLNAYALLFGDIQFLLSVFWDFWCLILFGWQLKQKSYSQHHLNSHLNWHSVLWVISIFSWNIIWEKELSKNVDVAVNNRNRKLYRRTNKNTPPQVHFYYFSGSYCHCIQLQHFLSPSSMCWLRALQSFCVLGKKENENFSIRFANIIEMLCTMYIDHKAHGQHTISIEKWNGTQHSEHVNTRYQKYGIGLVTLLAKRTATAVEHCKPERNLIRSFWAKIVQLVVDWLWSVSMELIK